MLEPKDERDSLCKGLTEFYEYHLLWSPVCKPEDFRWYNFDGHFNSTYWNNQNAQVNLCGARLCIDLSGDVIFLAPI